MKALITIGFAFAFYITGAQDLKVNTDTPRITLCEFDSSNLTIKIKNTSDEYLYFLNSNLSISPKMKDSCYFKNSTDSFLTCVEIIEALVFGVVMHPNLRHEKMVPVRELAPDQDTIMSLSLDFFSKVLKDDKFIPCRYVFQLDKPNEIFVKGSVLFSDAPLESHRSMAGFTMVDADLYYRNLEVFKVRVPVY